MTCEPIKAKCMNQNRMINIKDSNDYDQDRKYRDPHPHNSHTVGIILISVASSLTLGQRRWDIVNVACTCDTSKFHITETGTHSTSPFFNGDCGPFSSHQCPPTRTPKRPMITKALAVSPATPQLYNLLGLNASVPGLGILCGVAVTFSTSCSHAIKF